MTARTAAVLGGVLWLLAVGYAATRPEGGLGTLAVFAVLAALVIAGSVAASLAASRALSRAVLKDDQ